MSGSISGQLSWYILGYFFYTLCQILRQIPRRNNRICGETSATAVRIFSFVLQHQYSAHMWHRCLTITNFVRFFSASSWEECLPHLHSHLELQKHGIFPRYLSQHSQQSVTKLLSYWAPATTANTFHLFSEQEWGRSEQRKKWGLTTDLN